MHSSFRVEYVKRMAGYYKVIRENNPSRKVVSVSKISKEEFDKHAK